MRRFRERLALESQIKDHNAIIVTAPGIEQRRLGGYFHK